MLKRIAVSITIISLMLLLCFMANANDDAQMQQLLKKYQSYAQNLKTITPSVSISSFLPSTTVNVMPNRPAWLNNPVTGLPVPITIWGNSSLQGAGVTYEWDFNGDGTPDASGPVTDGHYIMEHHTYTAPGPYTARLTVTDTSSGATDFDDVVINVRDPGTLTPAEILAVQVRIAIEDGLEWLYLQQRHDGAWEGNGNVEGPTAFAALAYMQHNYFPMTPADYDDYIYAEYIQAAIDYLLTHTRLDTLTTRLTPAGNPDPDGDGGYYYSSGSDMYETGMVLMAIASTGTPGRTVTVSTTDPAYVNLAGSTYFDVAEDIVHYLAYAQNEGYPDIGCPVGGCNPRGGWRYYANNSWDDCSSDNSVSQWPVLGMEAAERIFGVTIPLFVKNELMELWIPTIQKNTPWSVADPDYGGSGYDCKDSWNNLGKTGALVAQMEFVGYTPAAGQVQDSLDFIVRRWYDTMDEWGTSEHHDGNYYANYAVFKGLDLILHHAPILTTISGTVYWRNDYNIYLVRHQNPDTDPWAGGGSWPRNPSDPTAWFDNVLASTAAILCLSPRSIGHDFVDIKDIDPTGFPIVSIEVTVDRNSTSVNSFQANLAQFEQDDFLVVENNVVQTLTSWEDLGGGNYSLEYQTTNDAEDGTERVVLVRVIDDLGNGFDISRYTAPLSGNFIKIDNNNVGSPGTQVQIPIRISDVTGLGISSVGFTLKYNPNLLQAIGATTEGTLAAGRTPTVNIDNNNGVLQLAMAGNELTQTSGLDILVYINFNVPDGAPCARSTRLDLENVLIMNAQQQEIGDFTVVDGVFSIPACSAVWINCDGENSGKPGDHVQVPVYVIDATDGITSVQFGLQYDSAQLQATGVTTEGTLSEGWTPSVNIDNGAGTLDLTMASGVALPQDVGRVLILIEFDVSSEAPCDTYIDLNLVDVRLNGEEPHTVKNGCFKIFCEAIEAPAVLIPYVPDNDQPIWPSEDIFGQNFYNENYSAPVAAVNIIEYLISRLAHPSAIGVDAGLDRSDVAAYLGYFMDTNGEGLDRGNQVHDGTYTKDIKPGLSEFVRWDENNDFGDMDLPEGKKGYDWTVNTSYTDFHSYKEEIDCGRPVLVDFLYWNPIRTGLPQIEHKMSNGHTENISVYDLGEPISRASQNNLGDNPQERWNLVSGEGCYGHTVTGIGYIEDYDPDGDGPKDAENYLIVHDTWWTTENNVAIPWREVNALITIMPCAYECSTSIPGDVTNDGTVSALDAATILQFVVGLIDHLPISASPTTDNLRSYDVSIPNLSVASGKRIEVPVIINDVTGVSAGAFSLRYDTELLRPIMASATPILSGYYWDSNLNLGGRYMEQSTGEVMKGEVRIAFAGTKPASGKGTLFLIEFEALANTDGRTSPIIIDLAQLAEGDITKNHGSVRILPSATSLLQNYPNPFNPETWLPYKLAQDARVDISIYDMHGTLVRTLRLGDLPAGVYVAKEQAAFWNGKNESGERVSSGVYFYTIRAGEFTATRRMVIVK